MASTAKRPRSDRLSAAEVLDLLEQENDSDDGMSSGEESELDSQLGYASDESR